ncbi:unnamed protein product [Cuscuta campestris]|uniref:Retrovirus-related Pol polyprotein from transposon TNT 1-94 n=1 Tax=Cuscuta campestris TaxID=132261 RepID=A0A484LZI7_9ASTE|nr:unnamed protein product [Cuscuta campestris]
MNVFNGLIDELKRFDVKISEEDQALLLLNSLPNSYEVYVDTILCGKDTITLEQAQSALLSFDARRKDKAGVRSDDAVAAIAHGGGRGRSSIRDNKSKHERAQVLAGGSSGLCSVEKSRCDGVTKTKTKKEDLQVVPCVESLPDERRSGGASREVIATAVQDDLADQMV